MPVQFDYETLRKSKCQIIEQGICPETFDDSEMPTDLHIVSYTVGGEVFHDAVRAHSMVDIFDLWHDRIKDIGHITRIRSGLGKITPRAYGKISSEKSNT